MPKRIPIAAAKRFAKEQGCRQVIIMAWDGARSHVLTYGTTVEDCDQAAQGGDLMKRTMKWPENLCKDMPSRVKLLAKEIELLKAELVKARNGA